ncbi:hypothetical protein J7643_12255 [bacterium]|nr:hypothetical protein [bacterium]
MRQLLTAIGVGTLLGASCAVPPAPSSTPQGTLQLSLAGVFPRERQLQYLVSGNKARVVISGPGIVTPLVKTAPIGAQNDAITLTGLPAGRNRIVSIESLDAGDLPIPGCRFMTTVTLAEGQNVAQVSPATTVRGGVFQRLLADASALATSLDGDKVQAVIDGLKVARRVEHYGLIDADALAVQLEQQGGNLAALDLGDARLVQRPVALRVTVSGLPANLAASVWVNDPVSPKQSGLANGGYAISPVKPGQWQLYGRAGAFSVGPVPVDLSADATASLNFATASSDIEELPEARAGAAAGFFKLNGEDSFVMAGGLAPQGATNVATDSVLRYSPNGWTPLAKMPVPVSHAAYASQGTKLYVLGGVDAANSITRLVQVYDVAANQWSTPLPTLRYPSYMGAATCLDGYLYMATGTWSNSAGTYLDRSIYRLSLGAPGAAWVEYGDQLGEPRLDTARYGAALAAVGGKLYAFGGALLNDTLTHRVEEIDAGSLLVRDRQAMPTARHGASALVRNGKVYVVGGIDARGKALANVEVYDIATDTWEVRPRMRVARGHAAAAGVDGKAFVVGGSDGHFVAKSVSPLRAAESMVLE